MTKLKLSSKMHVFVIVSAIVVAIGLAIGLVCEFVANGYFNYGAEYSSYNTVVANYAYLDYSDEDAVKEICEEAFSEAGVKYYNYSYAETTNANSQVAGGVLTFKFSKNTDTEKLSAAAESINGTLKNAGSTLSSASSHSLETELGNSPILVYGSIAIASAVVFQLLYFMLRYRFAIAFAALLANVHNLAIYVSLMAITRVPLGITSVTFGIITVLMTMICSCFLFDRVRRNSKDEKFTKLTQNEQVDTCVCESMRNVLFIAVIIAVAALLLLVLLSISALTVTGIITPVILAILSVVSVVYGTLFFVPSVYARFKRIGDNYKMNHVKKAKKS